MSLTLTLSMARYRTLRALPLRLGRSFCGLQEQPKAEHLWVAFSEERAGCNERREHETRQKLGPEEEHDDREEETGGKKAVVNTKLRGGFVKGGIDFEKCASSGSHSD